MFAAVRPHPEWRVLVAALKDCPSGLFLPHDELATIVGLPAQTQRYYDQIGRARRTLLREWQRWLASEAPKGYRLVEPKEFHGCGRRQVRLAGRRLGVSLAIHGHAPQHLLTAAENLANTNALAKVGALATQLRRVQRETHPGLPARPDMPKLLKKP
jgi:hypothetical protein